MMLKRTSSQSKRSPWALLRAGLAGMAVVIGGAATVGGCLDRPVVKADPHTSNVYVDELRNSAVDKIDLLFMIDNSISMADKQAILADAVPLLVQRLITPICVVPCAEGDMCTDAEKRDGKPTGANWDPTTHCAAPSIPEFSPIKDIHVGVVTSSLGSHGASGMKDVCVTPEDNDHAELLGTMGLRNPTLPSYNGLGFLKWDQTDGKYNPPGDSDAKTFEDKFTAMVQGAGEHGCGYEASLESWYRFLIDPEPPANVVVPPMTNTSVVQDVDMTVLAQRAAFLRPDSLVAIVMLSDENDCSIQDEGYGWLIARASPMYRSTSQCAANPNDKCCQSCGEKAANEGCPAIASDSECAKGAVLDAGNDDLNLRCWHQKQRFGFDLLYPSTRYSDALKNHLVKQRSDGKMVDNPLFKPGDGKAARDNGLVFLAGIIGVPWQDIANDESVKGQGLRYLTESEMESKGVWGMILGTPSTPNTYDPPIPPSDPFMIEQADERTAGAANPVTGDKIMPSSSTDQQANKINGHEQANMGNRDLQYACTFQLATPVTCDQAAFDANKGCDCFMEDLVYNRPLCEGGTTKQTYAKAYPGTRHLQVLKEFQTNSIVASICPKYPSAADKTTNPDYGYNPAVKAIIDRLKEALKGKCLPRALSPAQVATKDLQVGQVPCKVIEATVPKDGAACTCDTAANRAAITDKPQLRQAVLDKLKQESTCTTDAECAKYCTCELLQLAGDDLAACQQQGKDFTKPGYCYINATPGEPPAPKPLTPSAEALVKDCSADSKRLIAFTGGTPAPGAIALVACLGASLGSVAEGTAGTTGAP